MTTQKATAKRTATPEETALAGCAITPSFLEQIAQNPEITPEKLEQFMNLRGDALKEGPVVVLTKEAAYYLKDYCVNRDPDLGRRIDDALAAYRQREEKAKC
jgi:hypothetical protein